MKRMFGEEEIPLSVLKGHRNEWTAKRFAEENIHTYYHAQKPLQGLNYPQYDSEAHRPLSEGYVKNRDKFEGYCK